MIPNASPNNILVDSDMFFPHTLSIYSFTKVFKVTYFADKILSYETRTLVIEFPSRDQILHAFCIVTCSQTLSM